MATIETTTDFDGMRCPQCQKLWEAKDSEDYNESGFVRRCDDCGEEFHVQPFSSWMWMCSPIKANPR